MLTKIQVSDFLQFRKIDAVLYFVIERASFIRYAFKLGPTGKISSLEGMLREFGLLSHALATPVIFTDFARGLIYVDVMISEPSIIDYQDLATQLKDQAQKLCIPLILGRDYSGTDHIVDMVDLPHLLVGGTTGSGKSVFLHSVINTIIKLSNKSKVELVLVDPKQVEFTSYYKHKSLHCPIANSETEISQLLMRLHETMNDRFSIFRKLGFRDISEHNMKRNMPRLLVIIDEVQDLFLDKKRSCEKLICSLAQKGRAAGIHLIIATQHPSREIISAKIKSNFPARVGFKTANAIYSRVLLDQKGAENLLGRGDAIYKFNNSLIRFKAPYIALEPTPIKNNFWASLFN